MGFTQKIPEYQACVKFLEAISTKNIEKQNEIVDLTSPREGTTVMNDKEFLSVREKEVTKETTKGEQDKEMYDD